MVLIVVVMILVVIFIIIAIKVVIIIIIVVKQKIFLTFLTFPNVSIAEQSLGQRLKSLLTGRKDSEAGEDTGLMKHHVKYYTRMRTRASESSMGDEASQDGADEDEDEDNTHLGTMPKKSSRNGDSSAKL